MQFFSLSQVCLFAFKVRKNVNFWLLTPHMLIAIVCHHRIQETPSILLLHNSVKGYFVWKLVFDSHRYWFLLLQILFLYRSLYEMFSIVLKSRETQCERLHSRNIAIVRLINPMRINLQQYGVHFYMSLQNRQPKKKHYHYQPSSDLFCYILL